MRNRFVPLIMVLVAAAGCQSKPRDPMPLRMPAEGGFAMLSYRDLGGDVGLEFTYEGRNPPLRVTEQARLLAPLLDAFFKAKGRARVYRLRMDWTPELRSRLAAAAFNSPKWDQKKGETSGVLIHEFVEQLLLGGEVLTELRSALAISGYRVVAIPLEKAPVDVLDKKAMTEAGLEPPAGLAETGKVPTQGKINYYLLELINKS